MNEDVIVGGVDISPSRLTLSCDGRVAAVQPRVMDVLIRLAAADAVLSRDTLEAEVWRGTTVSYHSLPRAISQARKALRDVAGDRIRIESVPKRGYRLVIGADVPTAVTPQRGPARGTRLAAAAGAVAALGLAMHALGAHGGPWHYAALSALALATTAAHLRAGRATRT